jgi:ATP-dependent Clp protease adaptor protein ClpS
MYSAWRKICIFKECKLMSETITKTRVGTSIENTDDKEYGVYYHNDNITPFDFVILTLIMVFDMSPEMATSLAMNVHQNGRGLAGVFSLDEAYEKVDRVDDLKKEFGMSLIVTVEEI